MLNVQLSELFEQMADLMEIRGENPFRVNSFRRAARTIGDLASDIAQLAAQNRLRELPGIGQGMADRILEFIQSGRIQEFDQIKAELPPGLLDLLGIPGLGPKKVALIWNQLSVDSVAGLRKVIANGQLAGLAGFGDKSVQKIAEGLAYLDSVGDHIPLGEVLPLAEEWVETVRRFKGVKRAEIAGSLRRGVETIGDIDLLCVAADGPAVVQSFTKIDGVSSVLAAGETKSSVRIPIDDRRQIQMDLRVVPAESFGAAWQYFTGSKEHNVRLRERAVKQGFKLNEWGLFKGEKLVAGKTEESIYKKLGLPYIPAECREDRGEFDRDNKFFDALITRDHIRGDLHVHTTASDGRSTLDEMVQTAQSLGYEYLCVADHSKSSAGVANGLTIERMEKQIDSIHSLAKRFKGIRILVGTECDILANGDLDYPDEILAECDVVVASIHTALGQERTTITRRLIHAMENPYVHVIGHPTGRMLGQRPPSDLDMESVFKAAAETGTAMEINASWKRLDLKDIHIRQAMETGVMLAIDTDAHDTEQLDFMRYGVLTARRGWVTPDRVINTFTLPQLLKWAKQKRK